MPSFTIEPRRWYAMDITFPSGEQHSSPILVFNIRPLKSGAGVLEFEFWHAAYSEGVQRKEYKLRVLRRASGYLLTEEVGITEARVLLVRELSAVWLDLHHFRSEPNRSRGDDLQAEMDRLYLPAGRSAIGL